MIVAMTAFVVSIASISGTAVFLAVVGLSFRPHSDIAMTVLRCGGATFAICVAALYLMGGP
jgi:hypothetical protein